MTLTANMLHVGSTLNGLCDFSTGNIVPGGIDFIAVATWY